MYLQDNKFLRPKYKELLKALIESTHARLLKPTPGTIYDNIPGEIEGVAFTIQGMESVKQWVAKNTLSEEEEFKRLQDERVEFKRQMQEKLADKLAARALAENNGFDKASVGTTGASSTEKLIPIPNYDFVYLIRNGDIYKIGITENLLRRMDQLKPDEVLNVVRCKNFRELEKDLHSLFKEVRLPLTEYFRLSEEQISKAHKLMTSLADF